MRQYILMTKPQESTKISIHVENEVINVYGSTKSDESISMTLPFRYVTPVLNIISQLTDEDIPGILTKDHNILENKPWSISLNFEITPEKLFKEDD